MLTENARSVKVPSGTAQGKRHVKDVVGGSVKRSLRSLALAALLCEGPARRPSALTGDRSCRQLSPRCGGARRRRDLEGSYGSAQLQNRSRRMEQRLIRVWSACMKRDRTDATLMSILGLLAMAGILHSATGGEEFLVWLLAMVLAGAVIIVAVLIWYRRHARRAVLPALISSVVCLWTRPHPAGSRGFVQCRRDYVPFNLWSSIPLDDRNRSTILAPPASHCRPLWPWRGQRAARPASGQTRSPWPDPGW